MVHRCPRVRAVGLEEEEPNQVRSEEALMYNSFKLETVVFVKYHKVSRSGGRGRKRRMKTIPIYYSRKVAVALV